MDLIAKIGGRKFWMALITLAIATYVELHSANGLSATMAGFLGSIVAAFSMANYASSAAHMKSRKGGSPDSSQLDALIKEVRAANDPQTVETLVNLLKENLDTSKKIELVSGQVAQGMLSLGHAVQGLKRP